MRGKRAAAALVLALVTATLSGQKAEAKLTPRVVIAHIDSGINPYHEVFRDRSPLAYVHPSKYIPGYPRDAQALRLSLNAPTWQAAFRKDRKIWDRLLAQWEKGELGGRVFWIPGTKIIAATRMSEGGVSCPASEDVNPPTVVAVGIACTDYPILDEQGHGTMTASRMGGIGTSLCPECRIVSIEGLGSESTKWAADQGWIDVQTNSWGSVAPHPAFWVADEAVGGTFVKDIEESARKHLVYFASGNGAGFFLGWTPWPSETAPTLVEGTLWVGAHDNGHVAHWSGTPAHVVADGFRGLTAGKHSMKGLETNGYVCCSSASSPYAASEGAAILLEARRLLGDGRVGFRSGIAARGRRPAGVRSGPLVDGKLTLEELKTLVKHTAQARPQEGKHDGAAHWASGPSAPAVLPYGPGDNAFCEGCWTLPVAWTDVPEEFPAHLFIGYGGANEFSLDLARRVLRGKASAPDRSDVDAFFEDEAALRELIQHPVRP
ncbi:MAG TPA: S8 family serine peptidase [Actinomycetota bacterium]|jgi:hypothetical protein|nr:S8 family serine peptidase [Actinomycetota bacterium]